MQENTAEKKHREERTIKAALQRAAKSRNVTLTGAAKIAKGGYTREMITLNAFVLCTNPVLKFNIIP